MLSLTTSYIHKVPKSLIETWWWLSGLRRFIDGLWTRGFESAQRRMFFIHITLLTEKFASSQNTAFLWKYYILQSINVRVAKSLDSLFWMCYKKERCMSRSMQFILCDFLTKTQPKIFWTKHFISIRLPILPSNI